MSAYESYDAEEMDFESFDSADELSLPGFLKPGKKVSVPGTGLISATLNTPKGPAKLSLPTAVPTQVQFRQLESAMNSQTQRLNAVQAELAKVRRELLIRRRDQSGLGGSSMMSMLMPLMMQQKLKEELKGHTHGTSTDAAVFKADSSDALTTMLPLLFLMPGGIGGTSAQARAGSAGGEQDLFSNPIVLFMLMQAFT